MEYKLLVCEDCDNIIMMEDSKKEIYICPVCGTINNRLPTKEYKGELEVSSPEIICKMSPKTNDTNVPFVIKDVDEDIETALTVLTKYGWKIKFKGKSKKN